MTHSLGPLFEKTPLSHKIEALKKDILAPDGPQISTMRNYRFAILPYHPEEEFKLRMAIRHLSDDLKSSGWQVLSISLQGLLLHRLKQEDQTLQQRIMETERRLYAKNPDRALAHLKDKISPYIEGLEGIAKDAIALIDDFVENHADAVNRTVIFIGRTGALYPFFRSSSLLKHLDGKTRNLPVILLYPGERQGTSTLSFMGEMPADRDYRPRIYS